MNPSRTFANGARAYEANVRLLERLGLRRPVQLLTAGCVIPIAVAALALAFEGRSSIPLLRVALALPEFALGVRYLMPRPVGYRVSLVYAVYCNVAIIVGLFVATSTGLAFLKLGWMVATAGYVFLFHGRIAMLLQSVVMALALAIVLVGAAERGDATLGSVITGAASVILAYVITGGAIYAGKKHFSRHTDRAVVLSNHDELTGLLNRRGLAEACSGWSGPMAVAVIDLDRFKAVNDELGHLAGDELLRRTALRLRAAAGPDAVIARLGGDEFVVVAASLPADLGERLADPSDENPVRASVGYARGIADGPSAFPTLLNDADRAMYEAKRTRGPHAA